MTYQRREYVLADKLKKEFRGRGSDVSGMRATSTPELMRRAEMGRDPKENCAEQAFRENYYSHVNARKTTSTQSSSVRSNTNTYARKNRAANSNRSAGTTSRPSSSNAGRRQSSAKTKPADRASADIKINPENEIRVKRKMISPLFVTLLAAFTVMVMFLVMEVSNVYKAANEVSELESQLKTMQSEADELELKLEAKNDIREIEKIATTEYGMAKEDTLQRRYISLSDGERIEILDSEEEDGSGGVLLSSIFSAIGDLFD
ncbi:MAG: septum formation initiator family protein [Eubacteriales bacterium]